MTQHQLAEAVGVHWVTISNLERGKAQLTQGWMEQLAEALGVSAPELFGPLPVRTIWIEGSVSRPDGAEIQAEDSDKRQVEIKVSGDVASFWLEIKDDVWAPFFHSGDLIQFSLLDDSMWDYAVGRMCILFYGDDQYVTGTVDRLVGHDTVIYRPMTSLMTQEIRVNNIGFISGYHPYGYVEK